MKQFLFVLGLILLSGVKLTFADTQNIATTSLENDAVMCTMQYAPVCGVDGITYGNACVATNQNKVSIAHEGECTLVERNPLLWKQKVGNYIKRNVNYLALENPILGGMFYLTNMSWSKASTGVYNYKTSYEDGHITGTTNIEVFSSGSKTYITPVANLDTTFTLHKGSVVRVGTDGLIMKLIDLQDSTCPKNVQCIWAGEKFIQLGYKVGTRKEIGKNLFDSLGYKTTLLDSDYKTYATIKISKK